MNNANLSNNHNPSSEDVHQVHELMNNEAFCELNTMSELNKTNTPCTLSFAYSSSIMKTTTFNNEDAYGSFSTIRSKSTPMVSTATICTSCSTVSSSCCSPSSTSFNNPLNRTTLSADFLLNSGYKFPYDEFTHHYRYNQAFSSAFNNCSTNQKLPVDQIPRDQYNTDVQYSKSKYQKIWEQSNETLQDTCFNHYNINDSGHFGTIDPLDKLQAWLKSPFEECDMKWNSQFLGNTIKLSKSALSANCGSTLTSAATTKNMFSELSASSTPSSITSLINSKSISNNMGHFNAHEPEQYQHQQPQQDTFIESNNALAAYNFTKPSSDYLNTNISKQKLNAEEKSKLPEKPDSHKRTVKYNGHIKKPLNAFMLFMKEMRAQVIAECTLKESAAINQILGRKWHALSREAQAKYYKLAKQEKEIHQRLYPGWSARDNYATQVRRRGRATKLNRSTTSITTIGNNNNNNVDNTSGNSNNEKIYPVHSFPDSEFWYSSDNNRRNNSNNSGSSNSNISSAFTHQFSDSHLLQSSNSNLVQTYASSSTTPYDLIGSNIPLSKINTPSTPNYDQSYNFDQLTKLSLSRSNYCLNYRHLLSSNIANNAKELNSLQSFNENHHCQLQSTHRPIKSNYTLNSLTDLNYEPTVHTDDSSKHQGVLSIYENKYDDKNPLTLINSTVHQVDMSSNPSYPTYQVNYTNERNNTSFQLWQDQETNSHQDIHQYSCCPTSYAGFHPSNDSFPPRFTDPVQHYNFKSDISGFESSSEIQQHTAYFPNIACLQGHHQSTEFMKYLQANPYMALYETQLESGSNVSLSSCQIKSYDTFMPSVEPSFTMNVDRLNSKLIDHKYIQHCFDNESLHKQTTKVFTHNSPNESPLL
ncbi:unnamed protein product [Heterobilharzia americana]|nr:unnamed protein product [Heterobilharzia americana]CAH8637324.1 unnamed protein product [Heterobilharzia americana]